MKLPWYDWLCTELFKITGYFYDIEENGMIKEKEYSKKSESELSGYEGYVPRPTPRKHVKTTRKRRKQEIRIRKRNRNQSPKIRKEKKRMYETDAEDSNSQINDEDEQ